MSSSPSDTPKPKKPLAGAVILGILILAAALVWRFFGPQLLALNPAHETFKPAVFTPITGPLADRAKFAVTTDAPAFISTTLPVTISSQKIDFGQGVMPAPVGPASNLPNTTMGTDDDDSIATQFVPVKGAWLIKFSNAQVCNGYGACPLSLITASDDDRLVRGVLFNTTAKNVWVSNHRTNGNPDLIVDVGVPGQRPVRLSWQTDGEFPSYGVGDANVSATLPSPHAQ